MCLVILGIMTQEQVTAMTVLLMRQVNLLWHSTSLRNTCTLGADDDASGVAVVLESARILAAQRFGATILFVAFCGEEQV